jgi:hypothetical protein
MTVAPRLTRVKRPSSVTPVDGAGQSGPRKRLKSHFLSLGIGHLADGSPGRERSNGVMPAGVPQPIPGSRYWLRAPESRIPGSGVKGLGWRVSMMPASVGMSCRTRSGVLSVVPMTTNALCPIVTQT